MTTITANMKLSDALIHTNDPGTVVWSRGFVSSLTLDLCDGETNVLNQTSCINTTQKTCTVAVARF